MDDWRHEILGSTLYTKAGCAAAAYSLQVPASGKGPQGRQPEALDL
jgi:hypothetical protein